MKRSSSYSILFLSAVALAAGGCGGSGGSPQQTSEGEHLKKAAGLVSQYTMATKKTPGKIEEVRDWAVKEGKAAEADFSSTRDNEPYGIASSTTGVIVYEKTGKNGKCYILRMGGVSEIPADEVQRVAGENPQRDSRGRVKNK